MRRRSEGETFVGCKQAVLFFSPVVLCPRSALFYVSHSLSQLTNSVRCHVLNQYKVTRRLQYTSACAFRPTYLRELQCFREGGTCEKFVTSESWFRTPALQLTQTLSLTMLITKTHYDLQSKLSPNGRAVRIFVISPSVPNYPEAKFPGESTRIVVCPVQT